MGYITRFEPRRTAIRGDSQRRQIEYVVEGRTLTQDIVDDFDSDDFDLFAFGVYTLGQLSDINVHRYAENTSALPQFWDGMARATPFIQLEMLKDAEPEIYIVTANYERIGSVEDPPDDNNPDVVQVFDFEVSTSTERLLRSKREYNDVAEETSGEQQTAFAVAPFGLIRMHRAINKTPDSDDIDGVEIEVPTLSFTMTQILNGAEATWFLPNRLALYTRLVGSVNSDEWSQYSPGEVLCVGVQGRVNSDGVTEIVYRFKARKNRRNVVVDQNVTIPLIKGWQYLWGYPLKREDENAPDLGVKYGAFYVATLYDEVPFGLQDDDTILLPSIQFSLESVEGENFITADGGDMMVIAG